MRLFGIDVGRAETGYCAYDIEKKEIVLSETIALPIAKMRSRTNNINPSAYRLTKFKEVFMEDIFKARVGFESNSFAMIEDYAYGDQSITLDDFRKMDKMSLEVAEMHGVVYETLADLKIPYYKIPPSQLKCFVTGNGRCEKADMIKALHEEYKCDLNTHHEYDALGCIHVLRFLIAYVKNPSVFHDGTYEKMVCTQLSYDAKYSGVTALIRKITSEPLKIDF